MLDHFKCSWIRLKPSDFVSVKYATIVLVFVSLVSFYSIIIILWNFWHQPVTDTTQFVHWIRRNARRKTPTTWPRGEHASVWRIKSDDRRTHFIQREIRSWTTNVFLLLEINAWILNKKLFQFQTFSCHQEYLAFGKLPFVFRVKCGWQVPKMHPTFWCSDALVKHEYLFEMKNITPSL